MNLPQLTSNVLLNTSHKDVSLGLNDLEYGHAD